MFKERKVTMSAKKTRTSRVPAMLGEWVQKKLDAYHEGPRQGTPKGQPYPIPKHKYHAALLHLAYTRAFGLKDIARKAGVSYKLLSKWRTEERFRNLIATESIEYSSRFTVLMAESDCDLKTRIRLVTQELAGYNIALVDTIVEAFFVWLENCTGRLPRNPREEDYKPVIQAMETLGVVVSAMRIDTWGNKEAKVHCYKTMAERSSRWIEVSGNLFKLALERDLRNAADEIFGLLCLFAEIVVRNLYELRKELAAQGLDARMRDII